MSDSQQQIAQAIRIIEEQLAILKQSIGKEAEVAEGVVGIFDGEFMVEDSGKRHQVPPNYASKTMLVPGDTIRMIEDKDGGQTKYKQIGKAEREKTSGVLVKKDGKYEVLAEAGSFKVLSASIKHYNGEVGDQVFIQYPKQHVKGGWAAVEKVINQAAPPVSTILPQVQSVLAEDVGAVAIQPIPATQPINHVEMTAPAEQVSSPSLPAAANQARSAQSNSRPASGKSKSRGKSSSKSKQPIQGENRTAPPSSNTSKSDNSKPAPQAAAASSPVATAEVSQPARVETAFSDDDLV